MAQIQIVSITCLDQQEAGSDEIYFTFKDKGSVGKYTSNTMHSIDEENKDTQHTVHPSEKFTFNGEVEVKLYEDDPVVLGPLFVWGPSINDELLLQHTFSEPAEFGKVVEYVEEYWHDILQSYYMVSYKLWGDV